MTATEIYQAEKAAYIARRGIDRVALMQVREPSRRKKLAPPQGLNNTKVYKPTKRQAAAAERARQREAWTEQKRAYGKTPDAHARPRYRGGDRKPTHCYRGHEYTADTTSVIVNRNTGRKQRVCLVCRKQWGAEWIARKKAKSA